MEVEKNNRGRRIKKKKAKINKQASRKRRIK